MKKYSRLSSAAVLTGALNVNSSELHMLRLECALCALAVLVRHLHFTQTTFWTVQSLHRLVWAFSSILYINSLTTTDENS